MNVEHSWIDLTFALVGEVKWAEVTHSHDQNTFPFALEVEHKRPLDQYISQRGGGLVHVHDVVNTGGEFYVDDSDRDCAVDTDLTFRYFEFLNGQQLSSRSHTVVAVG